MLGSYFKYTPRLTAGNDRHHLQSRMRSNVKRMSSSVMSVEKELRVMKNVDREMFVIDTRPTFP